MRTRRCRHLLRRASNRRPPCPAQRGRAGAAAATAATAAGGAADAAAAVLQPAAARRHRRPQRRPRPRPAPSTADPAPSRPSRSDAAAPRAQSAAARPAPAAGAGRAVAAARRPAVAARAASPTPLAVGPRRASVRAATAASDKVLCGRPGRRCDRVPPPKPRLSELLPYDLRAHPQTAITLLGATFTLLLLAGSGRQLAARGGGSSHRRGLWSPGGDPRVGVHPRRRRGRAHRRCRGRGRLGRSLAYVGLAGHARDGSGQQRPARAVGRRGRR